MVTGVEQRQINREKEKEKTIQLVTCHFEQLFPNPDKMPTHDEFSTKSDLLISYIEENVKSADLIYIAIRHVNKLIIERQKKYGWKVSPITHTVVHREPTQLMNYKWKNNAWHTSKIFHQMQTLLASGKGLEHPEDIHRMLILSLIFHSGQHQSIVVKAFNKAIEKNEPKLHSLFEHVFTTLILDEAHLNTNAIIPTEDKAIAVLEFQCFLHPITIGLLRKWLNVNKLKRFDYPHEQREIYHHILKPFNIAYDTISSLKHFCQAASMLTKTHVTGQLSHALSCAQAGVIRTYSLPFDNLHRLIHSATNAIPALVFDDFTYPKILASTKNKSKNSLNIQFTRQLKAAFSITKQSNAKVSTSGVKNELIKMLDNDELSESQFLLVKWLIHKCNTCGPSTLRQYGLSMIRVWLPAVIQLDLLDASGDEILDAYEHILEKNYELKRRNYIAARIVDLHNFIAKRGSGIAPIPYHALISDNSTRSHTRSGFIDEALFSALLLGIDNIIDLNSSDKMAMKVVCLLMYRGGLRLNEVKKLQMSDIECINNKLSYSGWITIRNNKWGKNKTLASLRKVPINLTLLDSEKALFNQYLLQRKQLSSSPDNLFITIGASSTVFDSSAVSGCIRTLLRQLSGLPFLVTYHLRHSCMSRLQLLMELNEEQLNRVPNMCAYGSSERDKLKKAIFGLNTQFAYYELASFAGHESPEVTFQHYLHFSDLIVSFKRKRDSLPLTLKMAMGCQLTSRRDFKQLQQQNGAVFPFDLEKYNIKKLKISEVKPIIKPKEQNFEVLSTHNTISNELCFWLLNLYSQGEDINSIAIDYGISASTINKWITNATYLANLKTKTVKQSSRHIAEHRQPQVIPGKLKNTAEENLAEKFLRRFKTLSPHKRKNILSHLNYIVLNSSVSKSGVLFSCPNLMAQFIQDMSFAFSKKSWRANTLHIEFSENENAWKQSLKEIKTITEKPGSNKGRKGLGAVRLEFISPNEKEYLSSRKDISKMSSHLLSYIAYIVIVRMRNPG